MLFVDALNATVECCLYKFLNRSAIELPYDKVKVVGHYAVCDDCDTMRVALGPAKLNEVEEIVITERYTLFTAAAVVYVVVLAVDIFHGWFD